MPKSKTKIVHLEKENGELVLAKPKIRLRKKKDEDINQAEALFLGHIVSKSMMIFWVGTMIILSVFLLIFSYFHYDQDPMKVAGFFGYLCALILLSATALIPFLGIVISIFLYASWNLNILTFFHLEADYFTQIIFFVMLLTMLVGNVLITSALFYVGGISAVMHPTSIYGQISKSDQATMLINDGILQKLTRNTWTLALCIVGLCLLLIPLVAYIINDVISDYEIAIIVIGILLIITAFLFMFMQKRKTEEVK